MTAPALQEESGVTVVKLYQQRREQETVSSISDAIEVVKEAQSSSTVCEKIVTRDDSIVYNSERNGDIEEWESMWRRERKRITSTEPLHKCSYSNAGCTADDPCVECKMDRQIERHSSPHDGI